MDELSPLFQEIEFHERYRGYDPDEVDAFVDRVARAAAVMRGRITELHERVEAAESRGGSDAGGASHSDAEETLTRTLVLAQRTADAAIAEAREEADRITVEAAASAQSILSASEAEGQLAVREAQAEAAATRKDADDQASRVLAEAETDRRTIVAEAESVAAGAAQAEQARLAAEVAELGEYRTFLVDDIEILERHLTEERHQIGAAVSALADLLESPETFRVSRPPATSGVEVDPALIIPPVEAQPVVAESAPAEQPVIDEIVEEAAPAEVARDEVAVDEAEVDEVAVDEVAVDEAAPAEVAVDEAVPAEVAVEEAAPAEVVRDEVAVDEAGVEEAAMDDAATTVVVDEEAPPGDIVGQAVADDVVADDVVADDGETIDLVAGLGSGSAPDSYPDAGADFGHDADLGTNDDGAAESAPARLVTVADLEATPADGGRLGFETSMFDRNFDDGGPVTEAVPALQEGTLFVDSDEENDPFLAQLRDVMDGEPLPPTDDDALTAFFDQEDEDAGRSWFGRRR